MTYSVVVRNPNSWTEEKDGTREYEITAHCGHNHRSKAAAENCKAKLTAWYCICGHRIGSGVSRCPANGGCGHSANSTSAKWYHAYVEEK